MYGRHSCDVRPSTYGQDYKMQRQDSGYESWSPSPRTSVSHARPTVVRHNSTMSATTRVRSRPSTHRSSKPYSNNNNNNNHALYQVKSYATSQPGAYYQFPALDMVELTETETQMEVSPPLPQTTHYWTSDSTRRLEYAAIDEASRGVKGWVRKHLVPECFGDRHVHFDDDSGSVRRYRLDLGEEKSIATDDAHRRKGWRFWKE